MDTTDTIAQFWEEIRDIFLFPPYTGGGAGQPEKNELTDEPVAADPVNHPPHYTQGIECIDYIESHSLGFHEANIVKYVTRARHKVNELEDLKKAKFYLERRIAQLESK